jgi:hypothetical protein
MSFRVEFTARSRTHALQLLETYKTSLPAPMFDFIAIGINNLPPAPRENSQIVYVKAFGHLCSGGDYAVTSAEIEIRPTLIPD